MLSIRQKNDAELIAKGNKDIRQYDNLIRQLKLAVVRAEEERMYEYPDAKKFRTYINKRKNDTRRKNPKTTTVSKSAYCCSV